MVRDILKEQDIKKIVTIYRTRAVIEKYSYDANFDEICENEFNLNIPRYVDMFEKEPDVDISVVKAEIVSIEVKLAGFRDKWNSISRNWRYRKDVQRYESDS